MCYVCVQLCFPVHVRKKTITFIIFQQVRTLYFLIFLYFIDYAITVVLILPLGPPPPSIPLSLRQLPHYCTCPWVMCISSLATPFPILYFTSTWLFCHYLCILLNTLTSSPIPSPLHPFPHTSLSSGNCQNTLCIHDSVSVLLVCLVCFLDSIVDTYVFIAHKSDLFLK